MTGAALVLNGRAPVNCPAASASPRVSRASPFGGNDANDTSGLLRFVRIEFSGIELSPDNELNILTMNGVGRGTT